ncbi:MAG: choice-of-anchor D domain-containing protein [Deltaproteobacteria bacterium]|nr:choice-of-anchor D domain-containing protein [Deltaproteobacteria bacterium]
MRTTWGLGRSAAWLTMATIASLLAASCSDTTDGNGNGDASGSGNTTTCSGAFCTDTDVRISVSPAKLQYADLAPGGNQEQALTISHVGNSDVLKVDSFSFEPATDEFTIVDWHPLSLQKGQKAQIKVRYAPKAAGKKSLTLYLNNNDITASKRKFPVPITVSPGMAMLNVQPNPIDFGYVAAGATTKVTATVANMGTIPVAISSITLSKNDSPDFAIAEAPKSGDTIPAQDTVKITLSYTPMGGDADLSHLTIETADQKKIVVDVKGAEIAPRIGTVPPESLDLGPMELGVPITRDIKVCNFGLAQLDISKLEVSAVSALKDMQFSLKLPTSIAPPSVAQTCDTGVVFTITAKTDKPLPANGSPVASLVFTSNDPATPTYFLPVFAQTNAPKLLLTPNDYVDFAIVGKGGKTKRTIELFNEGTADLIVEPVSITDDALGEFSIVPGNFPPASSNPAAATIQPGKNAVFQVQFEAKGPTNQKVQAKLHIKSNDPGLPEAILPMYAERADGLVCKVALVPPVLNFGLLPYGAQKTLPLVLKNTGTGPCVFKSVKVLDCGGNGLPPPLGPGPMVCKATGSKSFSAGAPSASLFQLGPGEQGKVLVTFSAPDDLGFLLGKPNEVTPFAALLIADFEDASTGAIKSFPVEAAKASTAKPDLEAKVGKAQVTVLPGQLDFGVVTVGCKSPIKDVSVFNTGTTDAYINKIDLVGCGLEVQGVNLPAIPKSGLPISQAKPVTFQVQYGPQNVGKDQCQLEVYTSLSGVCAKADKTQTGVNCSVNGDCQAGEFCAGQLFTVPITGEGTLDTEFTDTYVQGVGKQVDVLFVVDNSGSMSEEQQNLANNFKTFTQIADLWQNNYHIGLTTTDMESSAMTGKLQSSGGIRVVTPKTTDGPGVLVKLTKQGTNGSSSEQGLGAAEAALTLPNVYDSGKACKTDTDCKSDGGFCIPNADDPATTMCGGTNRTFIRKSAGLEVVVLSDEEDQSASTVAYYTNFFYSIKGLANKALFHFHAIVGPGGGCSSSNGDAEAGERYIQVANNTGGKVGSICDANFANTLKDIGQVAFGLSQQFFLTRTPEASTIEVKVNGTPCPAGNWQYDSASNSVIFPPNSSCVPQKGDKVDIHYKMLCFP